MIDEVITTIIIRRYLGTRNDDTRRLYFLDGNQIPGGFICGLCRCIGSNSILVIKEKNKTKIFFFCRRDFFLIEKMFINKCWIDTVENSLQPAKIIEQEEYHRCEQKVELYHLCSDDIDKSEDVLCYFCKEPCSNILAIHNKNKLYMGKNEEEICFVCEEHADQLSDFSSRIN